MAGPIQQGTPQVNAMIAGPWGNARETARVTVLAMAQRPHENGFGLIIEIVPKHNDLRANVERQLVQQTVTRFSCVG